ncbi:MAG: hypothetical protein RBR14_05905 [Candidatus Cloacimonas acidaminovorans]|nr:hypothetical protein [Candidatus Cloacimonas acidaminovorans]
MLPRIGLAIIFVLLFLPLSAEEILLEENISETDTINYTVHEIAKTDIENWIKKNRIDTRESVFSTAPIHLDLGDLYHNCYFYLGRTNLPMPERNGFETFSGIFSPALYHGSFNTLYPVKKYQRTVNYTNRTYPFAPVLTSVDAGLGDYDHHYARINFVKNELFSYSELEYQGDLLAQNGFWSDITSTETAMKHRLSRKGKLFNWEAEYASWKKDIAMNYLLPFYWQLTNFKIDYELQQIYAELGIPWVKLKFLQESETASAREFYETYKRKSTRVQINTEQKFGFWQYQTLYEHSWNKDDKYFCGFYDEEKYEDKLALAFKIDNPLEIDLSGDWLDWKRGRLFADISYSLQNFEAGVTYKQLLGKDPSSLKVKDIFNSSGELELIDISIPREVSVQFSYNLWNIKPLIAVGSKEIKQKADSTFFNLEKQQPFLRLAMDANFKWKNWQLIARPEWVISKYYQNLTESPEYRFQSVQQIKYHLPYDNSLVAGCGIYGHSGYYIANAVNPSLIEASTILDAWAGFDVSNYFELRAGIKNALSSAIYGAYSVPTSLYVQVLWLYLN